ncbi:MAG: hypothetical protein ABIH67_04735 [Candidatus Uhrbacteria bacterium]
MSKILSVCVEIVIYCMAFAMYQIYERRYSCGNLNNTLGKVASSTGYHP